ncbi:MAG: inorganic diphosphatase [Acidobacteriia bacterium]|nr:inorganic diphosphatase [Terriglobia bacterium]
MSNLARMDHGWQKNKSCCLAVIETPKGGRNKFDYDEEREVFRLGGLLPEGLSFPFDFGFIPNTRGGDGDSLDIMVLMEEPAHVGCVLEVRLIGVLQAEQIEGKKRETNDRLFGVAVHSYAHENLTNIDQVSTSVLDQIEEFFISYNKSRGKKFRAKGRHGPKRAAEVIEAGIKAFEQQK